MGAIRAHHTETSSGRWSGPAQERRLSRDAGANVFRRAYAWIDPELDADDRDAYKFIHHEVDREGNVSAANERACINGIVVLNGGRGGADIPEADRRGVYRHLAAHLQDAGRQPASLKEEGARRSREARRRRS